MTRRVRWPTSRVMRSILLSLVIVAMFPACSKKSDSGGAPAAKPVEQAAATAPKPSAIHTLSPADEKALVGGLLDKPVRLVAPTGEQAKIEAKKHLNGKTWVVDVLANGVVIDTIDSGIADDAHQQAENGVVQYGVEVALGASGPTIADGAVVAAIVSKLTGKPATTYEARVVLWDAGAKKFAVARKLHVEEVWSPEDDGGDNDKMMGERAMEKDHALDKKPARR